MISPPRFWSDPDGARHLLAGLLSPISALYGQAVARKLARSTPVQSPIPVICAGNITMGGVGKTPFVALLAERLRNLGHTPFILMRGYGGTQKGPLLVTPDHGALAVGDEARMLAQNFPVVISRDRPMGAALAYDQGATLIIMDDGFQNPSLAKTYSFLLVDGETGLGNGLVFPAGPLREEPQAALERAQILVIVGGNDHPPPHLPESDLPRLHVRIVTDLPANLVGEKTHAFSGIGRPDKFFTGLETGGVILAERTAFADHHMFTSDEIIHLKARAAADQAMLLTTEKDFARLSGEDAQGIHAIPARMTVDNPDILDQFLRLLPESVR